MILHVKIKAVITNMNIDNYYKKSEYESFFITRIAMGHFWGVVNC
jgi:hypothetical protein